MKKIIGCFLLVALLCYSLLFAVGAEAEIWVDENYLLVEEDVRGINEGMYAFSVNQIDLYPYFHPHGYKTIDGTEVVSPRFSSANCFREGLAYVVEWDSHSGGYIDRTGKYIIPPIFSWGDEFNNGKAIVSINGKLSIINKKGEFLLSKPYDMIEFNMDLQAYLCTNDGQAGTDLYNEDVVFLKTISYQNFSTTKVNSKVYLIFTDKSNNTGVMEYETERVIIPAEIPCYIELHSGIWMVMDKEGLEKIEAFHLDGSLFDLFNNTGYAFPVSPSKYFVFNHETDERYFYENGIKQPVEFIVFGELSESLFEISNQSEGWDETAQWGAIDKDGNVVIPIEYDAFLADTDEEEIFAVKGDTIFVFNSKGMTLRQFQGKPLGEYWYPQNYFTKADSNGYSQLLDKNGTVILSAKGDDIQFFYHYYYDPIRIDINDKTYVLIDKNASYAQVPELEPMTPVTVTVPDILKDHKELFFRVGFNKKCVNDQISLLDGWLDPATPQIKNNRAFVPIRLLSECLDDAYVDWNEELQQVKIYLQSKTVTLQIGSNIATLTYFDTYKNDYAVKEITMDEPAYVSDYRTFIPLRAVSESLGPDVYWDEKSQLIGVGTSKVEPTAEQIASLTERFEKKAVATVPELRRLDASLATQPYLDYLCARLLGVDPGTVDNIAWYSNTIPAYESLMNGEKDLILVTEPSPDLLEQAAEKGVELEVIPFSKEGFVFLVNTQNEIDSLTQQQLKDIYQGKITNWKEVGGADLPIVAYQRNANSGSQTIMEHNFMKGLTMLDPLTTRVASMEGLIDVVAEFREDVNGGLGYSVYYYAKEMIGNPNVKLLSVDAGSPNSDSIRDGSYPLVVNYYAVKRKDDNSESTKKLLDFILSEEGQDCVNESGLVSMK